MQVRNIKTYHIASTNVIEDDEANKKTVYGTKRELKAYIYPADGEVQSRIHGKELGYILNMLTNDLTVKESDGVCVYSDDFDYEVISIKRYTSHLLCELKKL